MSVEVDEDGFCEVYAESERTARKPTKCDACAAPIAVGEKYAYVFIVFEGDRSQVRRCARCQVIHKHLREVCHQNERFGDGVARYPDEELKCGDDYRDLWGVDPPQEIAALAFALPGEVKL